MKQPTRSMTYLKIWSMALAVLLPALSGSAAVGKSSAGTNMNFYELYLEYRDTDYEKAMTYAGSFLKGIDSTQNEIFIAGLAEEYAGWCSENFLFSKAAGALETAVRIYACNGCEDKANEMKMELARSYFQKGSAHRTLTITAECLPWFEEKKDTANILACYNYLGSVYYLCRDFGMSNYYFRKYAEGARATGDSLNLLQALNNASLYALNINGDTASARQLIREAVALSERLGSERTFTLYINLINSYLRMSDTTGVARLLDTARRLADNINEKGNWHYSSGQYYIISGDYGKAASQLDSAISFFGQGELEWNLKLCYSELSKSHFMAGQYRKAYEAIQNYIDIDNRSRDEEAFLELLESRNSLIASGEIEKEKQKRKNLILSIAISVLILSTALLVIVLHLKNKSNKLKTQQLVFENTEKNLKAEKEIMELKKMQQFHNDSIIKYTLDRLDRLAKGIYEKSVRDEISMIRHDLQHFNDETQWQEISQYIPDFNNAFSANLLKDFPDLTVNERRLCVLLNLNMTTKEISNITKQSPNAINIARGRLRNKLGLTGDTVSLYEFLSKYN